MPTRLLYSSRSLEDVIYREELDSLVARADGLEVFHTLTRSHPPGWTGYTRRIDRDMLAEVAIAPAWIRPTATSARDGTRQSTATESAALEALLQRRVTATPSSARPSEFIVTREYRRFIEFCDECRRARYIGLCYGVPGVGKTLSARQYAHWDELEAVLGPPPHRHDGIPPRDSGPWRTVLYTPGVVNTPRIVERDLAGLWRAVSGLARRAAAQTDAPHAAQAPDLVIVDEADRLKTAALEQLRDVYDRRHLGLVLIGMPGLQKRLARYAQLYSRVGFVHHFQPLSGRELQHVVERQWIQLRLDSALEQAIGADVLNAIARVTGGNFRLVQRLFSQIERVLTINGLVTVTTEVVDAASETLVIGGV